MNRPDRITLGSVRSLWLGFLLALLLIIALGAQAQPAAFPEGPGGQPAAVSAARISVRTIYMAQLGVRERGNNAGPRVEDYLRYAGLQAGQPWCAAFVCWVYGQAGIVNPKSGWSPDLFPASKVIWEKAKSLKLKAESLGATPNLPRLATGNSHPSPEPGDVFGIYFADKGRIAHVGFVDDWGPEWVTTVEGNTNILGSREGDGVYRKRRPARSIYSVARFVSL